MKRLAAIFALLAIPALAYGQQGGSAPKAAKPTKADVQKVVQIISGDKAKLQAYCDSKKLYDQMGAAYQKKDSKTGDALGKQADALVGKLGPEYSKMMDGLEQVDPNSSEGKDFMSVLSGLDNLCTGPAPAQPVQQSAPVQPAPAKSAPVQPAPVQPAPAKPAPAQPMPAQPMPAQPMAAPSAPPQLMPKGACAQIRTACAQAGFVANGIGAGVGIVVDCIRPIIMGTPQRPRATQPLPQIDPQLVIACKNQNPNFGMGGQATPQQGGQ